MTKNNKISKCPFDFINEFDKWFYYHKCIFFEKLTHKQALRDICFVFNGWKRADKYYGMWTLILKGKMCK